MVRCLRTLFFAMGQSPNHPVNPPASAPPPSAARPGPASRYVAAAICLGFAILVGGCAVSPQPEPANFTGSVDIERDRITSMAAGSGTRIEGTEQAVQPGGVSLRVDDLEDGTVAPIDSGVRASGAFSVDVPGPPERLRRLLFHTEGFEAEALDLRASARGDVEFVAGLACLSGLVRGLAPSVVLYTEPTAVGGTSRTAYEPRNECPMAVTLGAAALRDGTAFTIERGAEGQTLAPGTSARIVLTYAAPPDGSQLIDLLTIDTDQGPLVLTIIGSGDGP